jgi:uracil-DNA glycosylase
MTSITPNFFNLCPEWTEFLFSIDIVEILEAIELKLYSKNESNAKSRSEWDSKGIYPSPLNIFNCFYKTPYNLVRVVLIGQDPYHTEGLATGLCFEVNENMRIPPSLQNIYKELVNNGYFPTRDGKLEHWAKQGVLLLNTALTVEKGKPESHLDLWKDFFEKVLQKLFEKETLIWVLLGQKSRLLIDKIPKNHTILEATHPSPLSAYIASKTQDAFIGSGIFKKINDKLFEQGTSKIAF